MPLFPSFPHVSPNRQALPATKYPSSLISRRARRAAGRLPRGRAQRLDAAASCGNGLQLGYIGSGLLPRRATIEQFQHDQNPPPKSAPNGGPRGLHLRPTGEHPLCGLALLPRANRRERRARLRLLLTRTPRAKRLRVRHCRAPRRSRTAVRLTELERGIHAAQNRSQRA